MRISLANISSIDVDVWFDLANNLQCLNRLLQLEIYIGGNEIVDNDFIF